MPVTLEPFGDFIILEPVEESALTEMGLIIPDNEAKQKPKVGIVKAVGPDVTRCEEGHKVVFSPFTGEKLGMQVSPTDYREYHVLREDALIARYQETPDAETTKEAK